MERSQVLTATAGFGERAQEIGMGGEEIARRLRSHAIPAGALMSDDFNEFVEARSELVHKLMLKLCGGEPVGLQDLELRGSRRPPMRATARSTFAKRLTPWSSTSAQVQRTCAPCLANNKGARGRLVSLVGVRGFEPPAPASRRQCSTRLSYTPTVTMALTACARVWQGCACAPPAVFCHPASCAARLSSGASSRSVMP